MSPGLPTIVVVDDAADVRLLLRTRLRLSRRFQVVGEAADGAEAVAQARLHRPSLMVLDVSMPGTDGLTALPEVLAASPSTRVVLYSGFEEQGLVDQALKLGAAAFVKKSVPIELLIDRLLDVLVRTPSPSDGVVESLSHELDRAVLDEHLERFREVFDEAAIGMATMTLAGTLVRVNRALAHLLERPAGELVGRPYGELSDDVMVDLSAALEDIGTSPVDVVRLEHGLAGRAGQRRVRVTLAPVRDSSGRPLYIFLQVEDVTVERAALEALRSSEERFRLLVKAVHDYAIFMLDPAGHIVSWNAGAQRSKGYTAEEVIGKHFRLFYPVEQQQVRHPERELELALRDGQYAEEGERLRKDGSTFWASVVITAVYDEERRHLGFAKVTRDVTERRQAEEVLRQSEERFRLLVATVQDYAIFMLDPTGHIVSWNAGAQRSKGYTASEAIGQHFRIFYPDDLRTAKHPEHELELALREGHYEEEGWRVRKDGTRFWANVVITAVFNPAGEHLGFTKVTRDNTDRRRLEQERERAVQALAEANEELASLNEKLQQAAHDQAQFLAVSAHELRSPIGVLSGSAELLAQHWPDLDDEERAELLRAIGSSTGRLRRLLDDLLTASRLQASALEMQFAPVLVGDVVADAVSTVERGWPDAEMIIDIPTDVTIRADRDRLAQAMENLIGNALRHGVPPVRVSVTSDSTHAQIRVCDQGAGVDPRIRPRLFERFATGLSKGGTGLGLFIVRELVRAHGGDASYEPSSNGTDAGAFLITLPVTQ